MFFLSLLLVYRKTPFKINNAYTGGEGQISPGGPNAYDTEGKPDFGINFQIDWNLEIGNIDNYICLCFLITGLTCPNFRYAYPPLGTGLLRISSCLTLQR